MTIASAVAGGRNNETLFTRNKCDCFVTVAIAKANAAMQKCVDYIVVSDVITLLVIYRNFPETFRKLSVTETLPIFAEIFEL